MPIYIDVSRNLTVESNTARGWLLLVRKCAEIFRLRVGWGRRAGGGRDCRTPERCQNTRRALKILAHAGSSPSGKGVIRYFADMSGFRDLLAFLMEDCVTERRNCQPIPCHHLQLLTERQVMPLAMNPAMNRGPITLSLHGQRQSILAEAILNKLAGGASRLLCWLPAARRGPSDGDQAPPDLGIDSSFARSKA